jgi:LysR family nitrogen assimilation transcriptional regulator
MNLRQLSIFLAVAENAGVSRAAVKLHLSQPAVTRHVRLMEQALGVQLLVRDGRGFKLTRAGERLERYAREITEIYSRALADFKQMADEPAGRVLIGLPRPVDPLLGNRIVSGAAKQLPTLAIDVHVGWTEFIRDWLLSGRMDIGMLYDDPENSALVLQPVLSEELSLVGAADDPVLAEPTVQLKFVADLPLILNSRRRGIRYILETALAKRGMKPNIVMESDSGATIKNFVTRGQLYSIFPQREIADSAEEGTLKASEIVGPSLRRNLYVATASDKQHVKHIQKLKKLIVAEAHSLVQRKMWDAEIL